MKIGFIGLGRMGAAMASNLVKAGIDRQAYVELLTSTIFTAPAYKTYGALLAQGRFEPAGFAAPRGYKDLSVPMPLGSLLHDRFLRLLAQGGEHLDWSAVGGLAAQDAGQAPAEQDALCRR